MQQAKQESYGLSAAMKSTTRRLYDYDLGPMIGLQTGVAKFRVPTKREQDRAVAGAYDYAKKLTETNEKAAEDPDIISDAKSAFIVFEASRDASDPEKFPAFYAPSWMMDNMTADQIAVMVNIVNEVRRKESPGPGIVDDEMVEQVATLCADHASDEIPQLALSNMNREVLSHLVVLLSLKLAEARAEVPEVEPESL
jgi:hypothetical protein